MTLLKEYLLKEVEEMLQNDIRLLAIGRLEDLPLEVQQTLRETMKKTEDRTGMILNLALSYGGRSEILQAVQRILRDCQKGKMAAEKITFQKFSDYLWTQGMPDPDLLIRTSGNFVFLTFFFGRSLTPNCM